MNKVREYKKIKEEIEKNYGKVHLCGDCIHTTECRRARIQGVKSKQLKTQLIAEVDFIKKYKIVPLLRRHTESGFIKVYDCDRFVFDGYKEDGTRCVMS